jgi:hypothetical protein
VTELCLLCLSFIADLLRFLVLCFRSKGSLAAENLFLRKQLGFYQERRIKPRRTSHPTRLTLLWLSGWFDWKSALTLVTPRTFIGWQRKVSNRSGAGTPDLAGRGFHWSFNG